MKILQVAPYFHPYVGGQERYVRCLARELVNHGHKVTVLTSNFGKAKKHEFIDGIEVWRSNPLCNPLNNPVAPTLLFHLGKLAKDFDIIHCHNEHAVVSQYSALINSCLKIPLVITCHGILKFSQPVKDSVERMYAGTFGSMLLRRANAIITISESDREYIHSFGVPLEKIRIIPNGVDMNRYNHDDANLPEQMGLMGKRIVLFVGPVIERKGPHVLVKAISSIVKEVDDVVFVFSGNGSYKEKTETLSRELCVNEYTRFPGAVPENQLHALYQNCEMLVLPSFSEALSYTILDAFAFSKPVVSSLIPCITDYLGDHALLVPPGDSDALGKALLRLLKDRKLAKELGANGRKLVETRFRWDSVVNQVEKIYREVLNANHNSAL